MTGEKHLVILQSQKEKNTPFREDTVESDYQVCFSKLFSKAHPSSGRKGLPVFFVQLGGCFEFQLTPDSASCPTVLTLVRESWEEQKLKTQKANSVQELLQQGKRELCRKSSSADTDTSTN